MTRPKPAPALGEAADRFLASLHAPETRRNRAQALTPMAAEFGAGTPLEDLDPGDIAEWITRQWGQRSTGTLNTRARAIRAAWAYWESREWTTAAELARVRKIIRDVRDVPALPAEILTPEEMQAILRQVAGPYPTSIRNRALIMLFYKSGLRLSEALAIKPGDINFTTHSIRVPKTKSGPAQTRLLHDTADDTVKRWISKRAELGINGQSPLFCTIKTGAKGDPLSPQYVQTMVRRVAAKAGVDRRVHPHIFRHTFAAELQDEGVPTEVIRQLLGQKSLTATARYLAHLTNHDAISRGAAADLPGDRPEAEDPEQRMARLEEQVSELTRQLAAREG